MKELRFQGEPVCNCECHVEGRSILHMVACCELSGIKYISEDEELILEKIYPLMRKSHLERIKAVIKGNGENFFN